MNDKILDLKLEITVYFIPISGTVVVTNALWNLRVG